MEIQGEPDRLVVKEILIEPEGALEFAGGAGILQIAQMLGQDRLGGTTRGLASPPETGRGW